MAYHINFSVIKSIDTDDEYDYLLFEVDGLEKLIAKTESVVYNESGISFDVTDDVDDDMVDWSFSEGDDTITEDDIESLKELIDVKRFIDSHELVASRSTAQSGWDGYNHEYWYTTNTPGVYKLIFEGIDSAPRFTDKDYTLKEIVRLVGVKGFSESCPQDILNKVEEYKALVERAERVLE